MQRLSVPAESIQDTFIRGNTRIEIISGDGSATAIPSHWRPILQDSDVMVLVPDMHMFLYHSSLDNFKFGAESMLDFLIHTDAVRQQLQRQGLRLQLWQLGDMYELCFPHPKHGRDVNVRDIRSSHPVYDEIVRLFFELDFKYVVGNHDAEHRRRRGGLFSGRDGAVYLEHGNLADRWFHFGNPQHRHWEMSMRAFRSLRRLEARTHRWRKRLGKWDDYRHAAIGVSSGEQERRVLPDPRRYPARQVRYMERIVRESASATRVAVVAHTHYPNLNPSFAGGECFYVDAGAWTEGRSDFVVITNSEIAVCRYRRTRLATAAPFLSAAS